MTAQNNDERFSKLFKLSCIRDDEDTLEVSYNSDNKVFFRLDIHSGKEPVVIVGKEELLELREYIDSALHHMTKHELLKMIKPSDAE